MSVSNDLLNVLKFAYTGTKPEMNKILVAIGIIILAIGLLWPIISKMPFGKLPGDIAIKKEGFQLYFPVTTMIIISLAVSIILWLFKK